MKIRNGFVSNSSSSSFVIDKHKISGFQLGQIHNHVQVAKDLGVDYGWDDPWDVEERDHILVLSTTMDNFNMSGFLEAIGVPGDAIVDRGW